MLHNSISCQFCKNAHEHVALIQSSANVGPWTVSNWH